MPSLLPLRLPLPALRTYVIVSVGFALLSLAYIHFLIVPNHHHINVFRFKQPLDVAATFRLVVTTIFREPWALLVALNLMICFLVLSGCILMWLVFNSLRASEIQMASDKLWNFVFYKFIFVFGIMNVQEVVEVVAWFGWFSVLAFVHTFTNVSNHRIRLYSSSPATSRNSLIKLTILLLTLFTTSVTIFIIATTSPHFGTNTFLFTLAESLILLTKTSYVCTKMIWYLAEEWGGWKMGDTYYTDFIFELLVLSIDFLHHLHMLLYGNIFLSMASLVISMQLRQLFQAIRSRVLRHLNYQRVIHNMQARFPIVSAPEDTCAICWEPLDQARKLPCSHLFHNGCLMSWLEQDVSCPTCRNNLRPTTTTTTPLPSTPPPQPPSRFNFNNRFHFDGSRIFGWLPSFSLEVSHRHHNHESSVINNMVWQVREVFPRHSVQSIRADLRNTLSIHATIDNITEGRLQASDTEDQYIQTPPPPLLSTTSAAATSLTRPSLTTSHTIHTTQITPHITPTSTINSNLTHNNLLNTIPSTQDVSFSGHSEVRQISFKNRKDAMLQIARRRYLQKEGSSVSGGSEGRGEGSSVD